MPKLTDPVFAKHVNLNANDRIHIVDVSDPTHDPAGSSKYLELGDLGGKLASTQTGGILPGSLFCIFAEESGALSANNFQWSFGNGDTSQSGFGVVVPFDCDLIAATLSLPKLRCAAIRAHQVSALVRETATLSIILPIRQTQSPMRLGMLWAFGLSQAQARMMAARSLRGSKPCEAIMDEELKKTIRAAVREGIEDALTKYGVDTNDPSGMQADMIYLRKSRTGSDEVIKWIKRSAITAALTGALVALWQGIKTIIHGG